MKRYVSYVDVLKKEIVLVKNVIKNPDVMKNALRTINYHELELYKFRHDPSCELVHTGLEKEAYNIRRQKRNSLVVQRYFEIVF